MGIKSSKQSMDISSTPKKGVDSSAVLVSKTLGFFEITAFRILFVQCCGAAPPPLSDGYGPPHLCGLGH